ncbi:AGAP010144-PA, partial [Anopheles gambiae str. PEST]
FYVEWNAVIQYIISNTIRRFAFVSFHCFLSASKRWFNYANSNCTRHGCSFSWSTYAADDATTIPVIASASAATTKSCCTTSFTSSGCHVCCVTTVDATASIINDLSINAR